MDGNAAKRFFVRGGPDIWIAVGHRVWWWTVGFLVLAAVSGTGCSSKLSSASVDSSTSTSVDSGCAPALLVGNEVTAAPTGLDTGLDSCADGTLRRRASMQCPLPPTSPVPVCDHVYCTSDADCPQGQSAYFPKGYCADALHLKGYCGCFTGCRQDADCAPGSICACGVVAGSCMPAQCATNVDCGAGFACVVTAQGVTGGACNQTSNPYLPPLTMFVCERPADGCRGQQDCTDAGTAGADANEIEGPACLFDGARRACGVLCAYPP